MQKLNKHIFLLLLFLTTVYINSFCQNKEALKQQKENIQKEIEYTRSLLEKTSKNKQKSLNYLKVLQKQITNTLSYLDIINTEIKILNHEIIRNSQDVITTQQKIKTLQDNLENLKKEYAKIIYIANKNKISQNRLIFVISAKSFNQAYKRLKYLKQYTQHRKIQAGIIIRIKVMLKFRTNKKCKLLNLKRLQIC